MKEGGRMNMLMLMLMMVGVGEGEVWGQQPDTVWTKLYSGIGQDLYATFIETSDGGYALGSSYYGGDPGRRDLDYYLAKLDSIGTIEWDSLYEGLPDSVHRNDRVYQMAQMNDGGYLLIGGGGGERFGMIVRTDAEGRRQWLHYGAEEDVGYYTCAVTADNDIVIGAGSYIWRFDDNDSGAVIWREPFQAEGASLHYSTTTSDGKFLFAGTSPGGFGGFDFYAVKFDLDGEIEWENYYGTEYLDGVGDVIETSDGGACIVGTQIHGINDTTKAMVVRVDANGEEIWRRLYYDDVPRRIFLDCVVETPEGGFAIGGEDEGSDFYLQRIDSIGNVLWYRSFERRGNNVIQSIFLMPDGSYVLGGPSSDGAWLIRTTPDSLNLPPNNVVLLDPASPSSTLSSPFPFPSPFNSSLTIPYSLARPGVVRIALFDLAGREVAVLTDRNACPPGRCQVRWDGAGYPAGEYVVRMNVGEEVVGRKVVLVR